MQTVAVGWLVYELTNDPLALGLVGLVTFLPMLLLALLAGHVADRVERRLVMLACYLANLAVAGALLLFVASGADAVWPIFALVVVNGAARAFLNPAGQALLPNLVPAEHFAPAVALNSSLMQIATIAGPALGGLLYALGGAVVFGVATLAFAAAFLLTLMIGHRGARRPRERMSWASLLAGLGFIASRPVILGAISLDLVAVLLGGATALLPIFARDILEVGPWGLGLLRSLPALGAASMGLLLAWFPLRARVGRRMLLAVALFGLATAGFGLSESLPLSLACLYVIGAADMVSVCVRQTLVQLETPDAMRGRVAAANSVFIGASNELGEFRAGTMAAAIGAVPAVVVGGVGAVLAALFWSWRFPELRDRDRLTP
jgi:MFS family permease